MTRRRIKAWLAGAAIVAALGWAGREDQIDAERHASASSIEAGR